MRDRASPCRWSSPAGPRLPLQAAYWFPPADGAQSSQTTGPHILSLNSWPPPPAALERDNSGVISGRAAKDLNLLFGTWISFQRRRKRKRGGGGQHLLGAGGRVRIWSISGSQTVLPARPHPKGCLKPGQVTPWKENAFTSVKTKRTKGFTDQK